MFGKFLLLLLGSEDLPTQGLYLFLTRLETLLSVSLQSLKNAIFTYLSPYGTPSTSLFLVLHRTLVPLKRSEWPCPSPVSSELSRLSSHPVFQTKVRGGFSFVGDPSSDPDLSLKLMKYSGLTSIKLPPSRYR